MRQFCMLQIHTIFTALSWLLAGFFILKTIYNPLIAYRHERKLRAAGLAQVTLFDVELLRPLVFSSYFATCITIPFFSHYVLQLTLAAGFSTVMASVTYVLFQVMYLLMLVPSGYMMEIGNIKLIMFLALLVNGLIYLLIGVFTSFWLLFVMQLMFGLVVPITSSAEYGFILAHSDNSNRNEALALFSNTKQGAMLAGIFCGGMLLSVMGPMQIFVVASLLLFACLIYLVLLLPTTTSEQPKLLKMKGNLSCNTKFSLNYSCLRTILRDSKFMLVAIFIAFPLGMLRDGVFMFSLPIMLAHYHIPKSIIGEVMLLFAIGFFISNKFIAKRADRQQNEGSYLFLGLLGTTVALIIISLFGLFKMPFFLTYLLLGGGGMLFGMFRGFLLSPAIALASKSKSAQLAGRNVAVSVFRVFEVLGTIAGPLLVGILLAYTHYSTLTYSIFAGVVLIFTLLFGILVSKAHP